MTSWTFIRTMALRESRASGKRLLLLTAAISIGVGALVAIDSFTDNLGAAVELQSRALLGSDLSVTSRLEFTPEVRRVLDSLTRTAGADPATDVAQATNFAGMAYVTRTGGARLVRVSAIQGGYPFYGAVRTEPANLWSRIHGTERVTLVDPSFLTALNAQVGDTMALGESRFVIAGTVSSFPGDVGIRTAFGPRVFIPASALEETGLLTFGSRAEYEWYLRTPDGVATRDFATSWRQTLRPLQARLRTAIEEEEDLRGSLDRMGRFLGLVALIALLLGGIGVGSAVGVFIRRKRDSIAVLRCLGASSGQVFAIYLLQAAVMGLVGSAIGVALGMGLQFALPAVFNAFLPLDVVIRPSLSAVLTGFGIGLWVALIFALLPLLAIRNVAPLAVLRRDVDANRGRADRWTWAARLALALSVPALTVLQAADWKRGLGFAAGIGVALLVLWLAALGLIRGLRRWFPSRLTYVARQGLANLYRPANQTVAVVLSLGFGAFLLGAIAVTQHNLLKQLSLDGGIGRPNLVFFDIQPDQVEGVREIVTGAGLQVQAPVPIVPMRVRAINGRSVSSILADTLSQGKEGNRIEGWAVRREYRSTYRDTVVGSEKLVVGDWWKPGTHGGAIPLSLEVGVAGSLGVTVRDTIVWDVQGVPITSVVTSLREVNWARFEPNFFAVFPVGPLDGAPQSLVMLSRVEDAATTGRVQRLTVERYPNVTSVDLTSIQQTIERIVSSVVLAIRFMALFSLATGVVVLIGALATSRFQRVREAALLKTVGATRRQVVLVMVVEYAALGALAAIVAMLLASVAGWALAKWVFEVPFVTPWGGFGLLALLMIAITILTGLWSSLDVFRRPPLEVLRAE